MRNCNNCNTEIQGDAPYCRSCGSKAGTPAKPDNSKNMSILAYIIVLIPLLSGAYKSSRAVKFHTNQGLALAITYAGHIILSQLLGAIIVVERQVALWGMTYGTGIYSTPAWLSMILGLLWIPLIVLSIIGITHAANGQMKPLPLIGGFRILK
jgi:uncharacterized Tic20 family protein